MQNLNSDQLRKLLAKHTRKMNWLSEQNDLIVELLAERGLKAIEKTDDKERVFFADKMVLANAAGDEVFNTDWPNPFVNPDQYEAHCRMADWLSVFSEDRKYGIPLSAEELKAGGWYLKEVTQSSWDALELYGFESYSGFACKDIGLRFCGAPWAGFALNPSGNVARFAHKKDLSGLKQIHRRGNRFYWGAPNG